VPLNICINVIYIYFNRAQPARRNYDSKSDDNENPYINKKYIYAQIKE
jgi:hypothetical protein